MHRKSSQKSALLLWTFWVLILELCLDILQFLHAKDVKKFGCVHSTVQKIVQQFLCLQSKCMLCEVRMLIDISDILGNITNRLVLVYHEDPFTAVWASTMVPYCVLLTKHNKIMGKEEGITAVGDFQDEDCRYMELNLMPQPLNFHILSRWNL